MRFPAPALVVLLAAATAPAQAEGIDWKPDLKTGIAEAQKSGQAIFVVTRWKDGV